MGYWAIVEIMGHRVRAGFVVEVEEFGVKWCRIEIPSGPDVGAPFMVERYAPSALFAIQETTKEKVLEHLRPYTPPTRQLPAGDEDYEDDVEFCEACDTRIVGTEIHRDVEGVPLCKACFDKEPPCGYCTKCDETEELAHLVEGVCRNCRGVEPTEATEQP